MAISHTEILVVAPWGICWAFPSHTTLLTNFKELHPDAALTVSNCDSTSVISYSAQIVPVLKSGCTTQCHGGIGGGGGHDMTTWVGVNADVVSGKLVSSVVWDGNAQKMPLGATTKISVCDIAKIKKWAAAAGPNN